MPRTKNLKIKGTAISEDSMIDESLSSEDVSQEEIAAFLAQASKEDTNSVVVEAVEAVEKENPASLPTKQSKLDEAKIFLNQFMTYLSSHQYEDDLTRLAIKYNVPKKRLATGFISRVFGVISDVFGVVVETTRYTIKTVIGFIAYLLQTGTDLICNFALGIGRIFTFNQGV